jgi:hypothetical protein
MKSRLQLLRILIETQAEIGRLVPRLERDDIDSVELVTHLEGLARLDRVRQSELEQFRHEASFERRQSEERSIRQFILGALEEIGVPQTAGFLESYVYARERVMLNSRNFGALRRDENRSWARPNVRRRAFIVPCLDHVGRPVPKWMARSDWPLEDRVFVPGCEELWAWHRVRTLFEALDEDVDEASAHLYLPLIEQCVAEARGERVSEPIAPDPYAYDAAELDADRLAAGRAIEELQDRLAPERAAIARRLATGTEAQLLWGWAGGSGTTAPRDSRAD